MDVTSGPAYGYRAYGHNLLSDMPLVQLLPGIDPALETITINRVEAFAGRPNDAPQVGSCAKAAANYLSVTVEGIVDFEVHDGTTLLYRPYDGIELECLQVFLMGSGLGALLMQRGLLVLHGNAVEIDGTCVLCVGPSGIGKSTAAAGLLRRGFQVISDDVCAINAQGQVIPGIPHIKLWQEAADALNVNTTGLSRIRGELEKFRVPLGNAFHADPVRVSTIYALSLHDSEDVVCAPLDGQAKFLALHGNTYRPTFVAKMGMNATHFQQVTALSRQVTVKRITRSRAGFNLDTLLDVLIADARGQGPSG